MEEYINTQQAADFLQIGIKHMYKLVHQKKVCYYKPNNGKIYFKITDLENYIDSGRINPVIE